MKDHPADLSTCILVAFMRLTNVFVCLGLAITKAIFWKD